MLEICGTHVSKCFQTHNSTKIYGFLYPTDTVQYFRDKAAVFKLKLPL